jgi:predicted small lipoprotein YifL
MMDKTMTRKTTQYLLLAAITTSLGLSACGIKGTLKTPPPVWGEEKPQEPTDQSSGTQTSDSQPTP